LLLKMLGATVRATLMLRATGVLALLFCSTACESASKLKPETAATLVAFREAVRVKTGIGAVHDAKVDEQLKADDTVSVPRGGFALVQLVSNAQVVRLDEELELKVNELALFGAAKTEASLRLQMDALLSAEEKKGLNERMSGFYATAAAAETRGAQQEEQKANAEAAPARSRSFGKANAYGDQPAVAPPSSPPPAPEPASLPEADEATPPPSRALAEKPRGGAPKKPEKKPAAATIVEGTPPEVEHFGGLGEPKAKDAPAAPGGPAEGGGAPPKWPDAAKEEALRGCLKIEVARLGATSRIGPSITVRYKKTPTALLLSLEGALPVPQCAHTVLDPAPPPVADAWQTFELSL
jgi:hypothetical protein